MSECILAHPVINAVINPQLLMHLLCDLHEAIMTTTHQFQPILLKCMLQY